MRYYRIETNDEHALVVERGSDLFDLTGSRLAVNSFPDLVDVAKGDDRFVDDVAASAIEGAEKLDGTTLAEVSRPLIPDEVWAAGVTYRISEEAREDESTLPDIYRRVYESERPELFFKATSNRTVGPGAAVGIRGDSDWDVPEPELGVVLHEGQPVGYTIGNDMSSRSIEGENPLYLPQAKVYDRSCAIGPCIVSAESMGAPHELSIEMSIARDGAEVFTGTASTDEMVRSVDELVSYYRRHNDVPRSSVLLTGTSIVPGEDFSLEEGDVVRIDIQGIGSLENPVTRV